MSIGLEGNMQNSNQVLFFLIYVYYFFCINQKTNLKKRRKKEGRKRCKEIKRKKTKVLPSYTTEPVHNLEVLSRFMTLAQGAGSSHS